MVDGHSAATGLRGRQVERGVLDQIIAAVRAGGSRALVVRGEAGVGKTALLEAVVEAASDLRVERAVGVESEMELAFAALHQLCAPMLDHLDRLPAPQREALCIVFGLAKGPPPDRFLVGLAVLSLFSEVADERPLLCVIDDSQWLDHASAQTLAFVGRRLRVESVGLLFGVRETSEDLQGLPDLEILGLRNGDARALLGSALGFLLDEPVRDRIVAETRGNPLALLELPRGLNPMQLVGGFGLLAPEALAGRIEQSFLRRLGTLPDETRSLLLVAAAEPVGDPLLVWRAAERLGIGERAAIAAEAEDLLAIGAHVRFHHPLVRSTVYRAASPQDRRAVHLALAAVTDPEADPDRRAWHLSAAATGPDDEIAAELERSAGRAQARGGFSAAAACLQRSVALTSDPARRADRALAAARTSLQAGAFDAAVELLATAATGTLNELQGAQLDLLRGQIAFASGRGTGAPLLLLKAAKRLEPLDLDLARETYLDAWGAAAFAEDERQENLLEICLAARALPPGRQPPRPVDVLLDGLAMMVTDGRAIAAPTLRQAVSVFAGQEVGAEEGLRWGWLATAASNVVWDDDGWRAICARQIHLVHTTGALERLPFYLIALGIAAAWSGDFSAAASLITEVGEVTAATGAELPPYAALLLTALRGREAEAMPMIRATLDEAGNSGQGVAVTVAHWGTAVLCNGLGRYKEAMAAAERASSDPLDLYPGMWALPELVEAAVRTGNAEIARRALDRLTRTTQPAGTDFGLGIEARSRALLSEGEAADSLYREAIDRLSRTELRPELARAHLVYGEWLRRAGQRTQARTQLHAADDLFTRIGMRAFAERTRHELLATGEKVRKRADETPHQLTAQERQIAQLARDGLSNPEIGVRLFISHRTVEWHLRKVFVKLEIDSRRDLQNALPAELG